MGCTCAPALRTLVRQLNYAYPNRDKASDGCCGDAAHSTRKSDHNPDTSGYAHAQDIDENLAPGEKPLVPWIPLLLADDRTKYIIYERRIYYADCIAHGSSCFAKGGHSYTGPNAHDKHLHLSIKSTATFSTYPWPMPYQSEEEEMLTPDQEQLLAKAAYAKEMWGGVWGDLTPFDRYRNDIVAEIKKITSGAIDYDLLATKVADLLAKRLSS